LVRIKVSRNPASRIVLKDPIARCARTHPRFALRGQTVPGKLGIMTAAAVKYLSEIGS
jgi:hypothetical protein